MISAHVHFGQKTIRCKDTFQLRSFSRAIKVTSQSRFIVLSLSISNKEPSLRDTGFFPKFKSVAEESSHSKSFMKKNN